MEWWKEWKRCREPEVPALWAAGGAEAFLALVPAVLQLSLFDWAVPSGNTGNLLLVLGLLLGAEILCAAASGLGDLLGGLRAERLDARLKQGLLERIFRWPQAALDSLGYGHLLKGLEDAGQTAERLHGLGALTARALPAVLTAVPLMFLLCWPLALLRLVLLPIHWQLGKLFTARDQSLERAVWEKSRAVHTRVQEAFEGNKTLRVNTAEDSVVRETALGLLRTREAAGQRRAWHSVWSFASQTLTQGGAVAVFFTAAMLMAAGQLSFGRFLAFQVLGAQAVLGIGQLLSVGRTLVQTANAHRRYRIMLEHPVEKKISPILFLPSRPPLVQFRQVDYGFSQETKVLRGIHLRIWPGERIALVGPSGCGKSTLLHLMLAMYPPASGHLLWDGISYAQYAPADIRRQTASVLQDNAVFSGTLRYNLCLGQSGLKESVLEAALDRAGLLTTIRELPEGLDTLYGAEGVRFSGGQRQRLALARAFIRKPRLLVLDEATSALDPLMENFVRDSLKAVEAETTVVTVAHRLETIRDADCAYVMRQGSIVETGNHETLMKLGGLYAEMHTPAEKAAAWN